MKPELKNLMDKAKQAITDPNISPEDLIVCLDNLCLYCSENALNDDCPMNYVLVSLAESDLDEAVAKTVTEHLIKTHKN